MAVKPGSGHDALSGPALLNAASGGLSSGMVMAALFPLDVLKTHIQTAGHPASATRALGLNLPQLYRGLTPAVLEHSLNRSVLFGLGTVIKNCTPAHWPEISRDAASGASAALVKTSFLHPVDTIKCRWQLGQAKHKFAGLYNGFGPAAVRSAGGMGIWLSTRNYLERTLPEHHWRHFVSGATASIVTDLCTFPFDTLKKNLQATSMAGGTHSKVGSMMRHLASGGILRFYHGYWVRLAMVGLKGAMENVVYVFWKSTLITD
eukprot:TRINITY_DN31106_c0_g1_i1.p1 TRINITY_DN31106_c0_g1~~TRINITY_DN31106_c0_g1_i1.p1  ORF type:complete len:262 (+),score=35.16 TRINITY_DN31106_c0_g1_i1:104-889(+)